MQYHQWQKLIFILVTGGNISNANQHQTHRFDGKAYRELWLCHFDNEGSVFFHICSQEHIHLFLCTSPIERRFKNIPIFDTYSGGACIRALTYIYLYKLDQNALQGSVAERKLQTM